jgi:hypothetical protein
MWQKGRKCKKAEKNLKSKTSAENMWENNVKIPAKMLWEKSKHYKQKFKTNLPISIQWKN